MKEPAQTSPVFVQTCLLVAAVIFSVTTRFASADEPTRSVDSNSITSMDNLIAWSIVPYDPSQPTATQRAEMLRSLGFKRFSYDWRPPLDEKKLEAEIIAMKAAGISMDAIWMPIRTTKPADESRVSIALNLFKKHDIQPQLWSAFVYPVMRKHKTREERVAACVQAYGGLADLAAEAGCKVGIYNHEQFLGFPPNTLEVIQKAKRDNLGVVYNFRHGRGDLEKFKKRFLMVRPYLLAVNPAGVNREGESRIVIGTGSEETRMMRVVLESGFKGPFGIEDANYEAETRTRLGQNLQGFRKMIREMDGGSDE